jgi:acyl carrier protein
VLLDECLARSEPILVPAKLDVSVFEADRARALLRKLVKTAPAPRGRGAALKERFSSLPPPQRRRAILDLVRTEVGAIFHLPSESVPDDQQLQRLGLDSLMALELHGRLARTLEAQLPSTLAFDHPTPQDIARFVEEMLLGGNGAADAARSKGRDVAPLRAIDQLSNEELATLVRTL